MILPIILFEVCFVILKTEKKTSSRSYPQGFELTGVLIKWIHSKPTQLFY